MSVPKRVVGGVGQAREDAELETSSEDYARRFAGPIGLWFLEVQARSLRDLINGLPRASSVLDVGGGHGQTASALMDAGHSVTILGSSAECARHLSQRLGHTRYTFEVGDLRALPYPDRAFALVTCFRLLPHSVNWRHLLSELCRVADLAVIADYPSARSVNHFAGRFFAFKRKVERNTRPYELIEPRDVERELSSHGFGLAGERPQFLLPMVVYRMLGSQRLARLAERPGRLMGLTRWLGSPVIFRADRRATS